MKAVIISDIHGRSTWKEVIYKKDNDGDILECNVGKTFDKAIFLGDYVDSFNISNVEILQNLKEIINLKEEYPDNITLLLGNHDVAYLYNEMCSGYRPEIAHDIYDILKKNIELFQIAFQKNNVILTHAGIHKGWWEYYALPIIEGKIKTRYTPFFILCNNIADQLNLMQEFNEPILRMCGHDRGGSDKIGGPLWVDKSTLYKKPLQNFHQIVGHSVIKNIKEFDFGNGTKLTFTDCINEEFYYLNV